MSANPATSSELRDIALISDEIAAINDRLTTRRADVGFGDIPLFDSNGELLGALVLSDGLYLFHAEWEPTA